MAGSTRKTIGSYDVERELGQGGMGVVYLAHQPDLERRVVIKTLRKGLSEDDSHAERFTREARAAAAVHHQNVAVLYDCFTVRGERFIAQEYVDGHDLAEILGTVHRVEPGAAAAVALEIARGLEEIHERGIVHRDLKPANILLSRTGEAKIADFGIALDATGPALTQVGFAVGTPAYMAPEQLLGERADHRSDVFAFGVVLYEMTTGRVPFPEQDSENDSSLLRRIEAGQYVGPRRIAPEIPRRLARLIRRCLHPKPKRRIASATELRRALEQIVGQPAPLDCRRTIADWLWARNVFKSDGDGTVRSPRRMRALRKLRTPVRLAAASAALFVLVADVGAIHLGGLRGLPIARLLGADGTAWVRFETEPGTEIRIGSVPLDAAARSGAIELPAGRHDVVFVHPARGRVERTLSLDAGEELVIGHVFSGDDASPGD